MTVTVLNAVHQIAQICEKNFFSPGPLSSGDFSDIELNDTIIPRHISGCLNLDAFHMEAVFVSVHVMQIAVVCSHSYQKSQHIFQAHARLLCLWYAESNSRAVPICSAIFTSQESGGMS
jgi:hypothetical protein